MKTKLDLIKKIRKLALKKGTPLVSVSWNGKAVSFQYMVGTRLKGYSYPNLQKAASELSRLAT